MRATGPRTSGTGRAPAWRWPVGTAGTGPGITARAGRTAQAVRAVRAGLPEGPPAGVAGPAGAGAARA